MEIYSKKDYVQVTYEQEKNYVLFKWEDIALPLEDMKELHANILGVVKAENVKAMIPDTSKAKNVLFPEVIEWWSKIQVPKLAEAGLEKIITVKGGNALTRISNKSWQGATGGIDLYEVPTLAEAESLINEEQLA